MKSTLMLMLAIVIAGCSQGSAGSGQPVAALPVQAAPASQKQSDAEPAATVAPPTATVETAERNEPPEFGSAMAKAHPDQARAMLAAAQKGWEATKASYDVGTETLSNLHLRSWQLFFAQRALADTKDQDLAALLEYWKRTKKIYLKVRALNSTGTQGGETEKLAAASYYLAEAELSLLEAGGAIPDNVD